MREPTLLPISTVQVASERDVVHARQRARHLAALLGFGSQDQARIATATSEICRNVVKYAKGGRCEFLLEDGVRHALVVRTTDQGPGIANLDQVLGGRYVSPTGMGLGLVGTRRLMDRFRVDTQPGKGTQVVFGKDLPGGASLPRAADIAQQLARTQPPDVEAEILQSEHELLRAIAELRSRNEELEQIRGELEETNRGVVALYAELDQKAESLRNANELKSRFLSNMSHEFRTPLNSIQSLARIVLDGSEGPLTDGQRKAVELIRKSAIDLTDMVNDLLDLAKIEAGKIAVRPQEFEVAHLFGSLRGVLRPLLHETAQVQLVFDTPPDALLSTDEGKVSQILRNFVSNALKFTERGEVRVGWRFDDDASITFFVHDTGIGIAPEDHQRIFEEFTQIEGLHQKRVKGTGLGLPLSRKLAQMLGGDIFLESALGRGSTFFLRIPRRFVEAGAPAPAHTQAVLALIDDGALVARWDQFLAGTRYRLVAARSVEEARGLMRRERPAAVLVAPIVGGAPTRPLLADLRKDEATRGIPIIGYARADHEARQLALASDVIVRGIDERHELLETLARALSPPRRVLLISRDGRDELRAQLAEPRLELLEARDGAEGLRRAREERPRAVVVDAGTAGFAQEAVALLRDDPETSALPVLVRATHPLEAGEQEALEQRGARVVHVQQMLREEAARTLRSAIWDAGGAHA